MALNNEVATSPDSGPTIPLLDNYPDTSAEPINISEVFSIGASAVSYLLTGKPELKDFSIPRLITTRERLHHAHLAAVVAQTDPYKLLQALGAILRD